MINISPANDLFTLVITIAIRADEHGELLQQFVDTTREHSRAPGFVSCTLHSSPEHGRLAEYIQWRDRRSWEAVTSSAAGKEHVEKFLPDSDVGIYDVASVQVPRGTASRDSAARMTPRLDVLTTLTVIHCVRTVFTDLLAATSEVVEALRQQPGFLAAGVHRGVDEDRVAVYGQWVDEHTWATALSARDVAPLLQRANALGSGESRAYRADFVADGPTT